MLCRDVMLNRTVVFSQTPYTLMPPWFVGKDVAQVLGYNNTRDALHKHVDAEDKNTVAFHDGTSGNPNQTIINESGLYSLILSSKLPGAKKFNSLIWTQFLMLEQKGGFHYDR